MHFHSKTFELAATIEQLVSWSIFLKTCDLKKNLKND